MTAFEIPQFTFWNITFTAIGATVFWARAGRSKLKVAYLSELMAVLPMGDNNRKLLEFLVFICLGCLVGIAVADPRNARQALTAGFAWTTFFAKRS